jgi:hypothetical protein
VPKEHFSIPLFKFTVRLFSGGVPSLINKITFTINRQRVAAESTFTIYIQHTLYIKNNFSRTHVGQRAEVKMAFPPFTYSQAFDKAIILKY